jgi:hypothetical protein
MPFNKLLHAGTSAGFALVVALTPAALAEGKHKAAQGKTGGTARIELPPGDDVLPDRPYAEAVDRNCLSCHSTETILNQPALSREVWKAEIDKMRTAYGAQIDLEADDGILAYLTTINGVRRDRWR